MSKKFIFVVILSIVGIIVGYFNLSQIRNPTTSEPTIKGRWYTESQVTLGQKLFQNNCAVCHGNNAQGTSDWRKRLADGSYPPPPLNGTAHTWHHPMNILQRTIREGSVAIGGNMPPFKNKLSENEIESVIAYFQSKWSPKIYEIWENSVNK